MYAQTCTTHTRTYAHIQTCTHTHTRTLAMEGKHFLIQMVVAWSTAVEKERSASRVYPEIKHANTCTHEHVRRTHIRTYTYKPVHTHIYTCVHTHTHIYNCVRTHTHTCSVTCVLTLIVYKTHTNQFGKIRAAALGAAKLTYKLSCILNTFIHIAHTRTTHTAAKSCTHL